MKKWYFVMLVACLTVAALGSLSVARAWASDGTGTEKSGASVAQMSQGVHHYNNGRLSDELFERIYRPPDPGIVCAAPVNTNIHPQTGTPLYIMVRSILI